MSDSRREQYFHQQHSGGGVDQYVGWTLSGCVWSEAVLLERNGSSLRLKCSRACKRSWGFLGFHALRLLGIFVS